MVAGIWCWKWGKEPWQCIPNWKPFRMHTSAEALKKALKHDLPPNILWLPLSGNHIHWHSHEEAWILAYWLSKRRRRFNGLQFLTHHFCPELPPGGDYKWICNILSTPFQRTYHIHCSSLNQNLYCHIKYLKIAPHDIHVTFTSVFKCLCI